MHKIFTLHTQSLTSENLVKVLVEELLNLFLFLFVSSSTMHILVLCVQLCSTTDKGG